MYINNASSILFEQNENICNFQNIVTFLRTFSTQMRKSEFSLCSTVRSINISINILSVTEYILNDFLIRIFAMESAPPF